MPLLQEPQIFPLGGDGRLHCALGHSHRGWQSLTLTDLALGYEVKALYVSGGHQRIKPCIKKRQASFCTLGIYSGAILWGGGGGHTQ